MERIWLSPPHMGETEQKYVNDAFASNWIAPLGANVDAFEKQLSQYLGGTSVVALSSGTAAIHLALKAIGVTIGDVVLCQSFTFAASAFPITYCGATPIFIDSEPDTWNIDPVLLEKAIEDSLNLGKKPAAIVVVHLYGMPAKMNEIVAIAQKYQIPIIEDAAEALGSTYYDKPCGAIGDIGILSFNGNKIITTSGGGAFISNSDKYIAKAKHLSDQAKDPAPFYLHSHIGHNYRLSNVLAGIGRGQMEVLTKRVKRRREIFEQYKKQLSDIAEIEFLNEPLHVTSNRWLTTILIKKGSSVDVEKIRLHLESVNIDSRLLWKPLHQQPIFNECKVYNNGVADTLFSTGLCLPSGSSLSNESLDKIVYEIKKCFYGK